MGPRRVSIGSCLAGFLLAACSGGGSPGPGGGGTPPPGTTGQASQPLSVTIDRGPQALAASGQVAANVLYATVTVCTPGSTTACQDIDHVQVDTGSIGLRLVHEALSGVATLQPVLDPQTGAVLEQCAVFADGYTWGSVVRADVVIAGRRIQGMALNVIGDPASGTAPGSCSSGSGPAEGTVAAFGANGVLGVGVFLQDCGQYCVQQFPSSGPAPYYACSGAGTAGQSCTPTTVPIANQLWNPVALLPSDNNGLQIQLPEPAASGVTSLGGTLVFGIGTNGGNGLGSASLVGADPGYGTISTSYGGHSLDQSVIDSGSSAYFFSDSSLPSCGNSGPGNGFYCPAAPVTANASISGTSGAAKAVSFTVANADTLFGSNGAGTVFPDLAGPIPGTTLSAQTFDWGLPFFFGRSVYVLFENATVAGTTGPAFGF